jgi:hypothetical protein
LARARGRKPGVLARGYGRAPGAPLNDEGMMLQGRLPWLLQEQDPDRVAAEPIDEARGFGLGGTRGTEQQAPGTDITNRKHGLGQEKGASTYFALRELAPSSLDAVLHIDASVLEGAAFQQREIDLAMA